MTARRARSAKHERCDQKIDANAVGVSSGSEPAMAANSAHAKTFAMPRPPGMRLIQTCSAEYRSAPARDLPIASAALFDKLRKEQSVLITPGAHFGIGKYIRIGYGDDTDRLQQGLARIDRALAALRHGRAGRSAAAR